MMFLKDTAQRNRHLLDMANGQPCLIRIPGVCHGNDGTVVAAHSNQSRHSKGKARKAHDQYSVWACVACHHWIDQSGIPSREEKRDAWDKAHIVQRLVWETMAQDPQESEKDRKAAQWALERL
jgi:hypothetical protein